ncbi:hypothetical protein [Roseateles sp.]|uniref:hypothetical protein n=1 Tax=Roseateles sp. TaxID=1971397 RepID=UPI002E0B399B|nr:hypothetical protein [Roseateles sp.]
MSGIATTVKSEVQAAERGFHTLAARIELIGKHLADAVAHPFTPAPLREALPNLMTVLEDIRQELAELRKPCPCEGGLDQRGEPQDQTGA